MARDIRARSRHERYIVTAGEARKNLSTVEASVAFLAALETKV